MTHKKGPPPVICMTVGTALFLLCLAASYFPRNLRSKYHRRWRSSRSCSGWVRVFPLRHGHQTVLQKVLCRCTVSLRNWISPSLSLSQPSSPCQVKPSTDSYPSAPHITTFPHRTDLPCLLQGVLLPYRNGIRYLEVGFALRCFQRLSRPDLATQRCSWQNNWNTSGQFIPVLSY